VERCRRIFREHFSRITSIVLRKHKTLKLEGNKIRINDTEVFSVTIPINRNPKVLFLSFTCHVSPTYSVLFHGEMGTDLYIGLEHLSEYLISFRCCEYNHTFLSTLPSFWVQNRICHIARAFWQKSWYSSLSHTYTSTVPAVLLRGNSRNQSFLPQSLYVIVSYWVS
jgi:hypothetical protein